MIIKHHEKPDTRTGSISLSDQRIVREYTREFQLETSEGDVTGAPGILLYVKNTVGIGIGSPLQYPDGSFDNFAFCTKIDCKHSDGKFWDVTISYATLDPQLCNENPLENVPVVTTEFIQWDEPIDKDIDGKPILNSAGDPFDPGLTRERNRQIIRISRNEQEFDVGLLALQDTVNRDTFIGFRKETVKCSPIHRSREFDPVVGVYWRVEYEFIFDPRGWKKEILDSGLRKRDGSVVSQIEVDGSPTTSPVPLDGAGQPLEQPVTAESAVYLSFEVYEKMDFEVFNFTHDSVFGSGGGEGFSGGEGEES